VVRGCRAGARARGTRDAGRRSAGSPAAAIGAARHAPYGASVTASRFRRAEGDPPYNAGASCVAFGAFGGRWGGRPTALARQRWALEGASGCGLVDMASAGAENGGL